MFPRSRFLPIIAAALVAISGSSVSALDLATFDIIEQGAGAGDMTSLRITISDQTGIGPAPTYSLDLLISPADVGTTFTITAASDPDFAAFKSTVTNGTSDFFGYLIDDLPGGGGSGTGWTESNLFAAGTHSFGPGSFSSIGQLSGPDFAGYEITGVTIRIDSFDLTSGSGFHSDDFHATATIIAAPVPEPSGVCASLLGVGVLAWQIWQRLTRRHRVTTAG